MALPDPTIPIHYEFMMIAVPAWHIPSLGDMLITTWSTPHYCWLSDAIAERMAAQGMISMVTEHKENSSHHN